MLQRFDDGVTLLAIDHQDVRAEIGSFIIDPGIVDAALEAPGKM